MIFGSYHKKHGDGEECQTVRGAIAISWQQRLSYSGRLCLAVPPVFISSALTEEARGKPDRRSKFEHGVFFLNWEPIITDTLISDVIPEEYAGYRAPVRETLIFFLQGFPEARQSDIFKKQISLPPAPTAPERISLLEAARRCTN